jgi:hypothetical protein
MRFRLPRRNGSSPATTRWRSVALERTNLSRSGRARMTPVVNRVSVRFLSVAGPDSQELGPSRETSQPSAPWGACGSGGVPAETRELAPTPSLPRGQCGCQGSPGAPPLHASRRGPTSRAGHQTSGRSEQGKSGDLNAILVDKRVHPQRVAVSTTAHVSRAHPKCWTCRPGRDGPSGTPPLAHAPPGGRLPHPPWLAFELQSGLPGRVLRSPQVPRWNHL